MMSARLWPVGLLILAGCSTQTGRDGYGMISGKITFQHKPLTGGSIHFFQDQERVGSFMIRGDGTYAAEIPVGRVTVAVETTSVKYQDREEVLKEMKEKGFDVPQDHRKPKSPAFTAAKTAYVDIPERYGDPEKSGLEHNVVPGQHIRDFDLK
jgi:hypothetical protein